MCQLGITLAHTQPYDPKSEGKIERLFQNNTNSVLSTASKQILLSLLEELNERFWRWLEEDYHRKDHMHHWMGKHHTKYFNLN